MANGKDDFLGPAEDPEALAGRRRERQQNQLRGICQYRRALEGTGLLAGFMERIVVVDGSAPQRPEVESMVRRNREREDAVPGGWQRYGLDTGINS